MRETGIIAASLALKRVMKMDFTPAVYESGNTHRRGCIYRALVSTEACATESAQTRTMPRRGGLTMRNLPIDVSPNAPPATLAMRREQPAAMAEEMVAQDRPPTVVPTPAPGHAQLVGVVLRLGGAPNSPEVAASPAIVEKMRRRQFEGSRRRLGPMRAAGGNANAPGSRRGSRTCGGPSTTTRRGWPLNALATGVSLPQPPPPIVWRLYVGALPASARAALMVNALTPSSMPLHKPLRERPSTRSRTHLPPMECG